MKHGRSRPENRGGGRRIDKYSGYRSKVQAHIEQFHCQASHYGRRGLLVDCDLPFFLAWSFVLGKHTGHGFG